MKLVWNMLAAMIAVLALGATCTSSGADTYTWTDQDGNMHFSDTPPATGQAKTIRPPVRPASHCALMMDEVEAWEKDARPWLRKAQEAYMSRDGEGFMESGKKLDTEQGRAMEDKIHAEEKKCRGGDADACKCMQSIDEKFSKMRSAFWDNVYKGR
jgi:hypothetical protein